MKTKHFFLTAFAVITLVAATFSNIFSSDNITTLKCYDNQLYKVTDTTDNNPGGPQNPPTGH